MGVFWPVCHLFAVDTDQANPYNGKGWGIPLSVCTLNYVVMSKEVLIL